LQRKMKQDEENKENDGAMIKMKKMRYEFEE
jgi:hypothetical protein